MLFPTQYIYVLNIVVVAIFIIFAYSGYKQGFLLKVLGCIGFMIVGIVSWLLSSPLGKLFHVFPSDLTPLDETIIGPIFYDQMNRICVFVILFVILGIVIICLKPILKLISSIPIISQVNSVAGVIFGFLQGLILMVVVSFLFSTPLFANGKTVIKDSFLSPVNVVTEKLLFFSQDTLGQLASIQKIVTPSEKLNGEDVENIQAWLLENDFTQAQIDAFLQSLGV